MNTTKFKTYFNLLLLGFKEMAGFSRITDLEEKIAKAEVEHCWKFGMYDKDEKMVDYAIKHYPGSVNKINLNFHFSIAKKVIDAGYDPFPVQHTLVVFKKNPEIMELFLKKGMTFEHMLIAQKSDIDTLTLMSKLIKPVTFKDGESSDLLGFIEPLLELS